MNKRQNKKFKKFTLINKIFQPIIGKSSDPFYILITNIESISNSSKPSQYAIEYIDMESIAQFLIRVDKSFIMYNLRLVQHKEIRRILSKFKLEENVYKDIKRLVGKKKR